MMTRALVLLAILLVAAAARAFAAPDLSPVESFLVDVRGQVVGEVEVLDVRDDWIVVAEDGDHVPVMRARCRMVQSYVGADLWPEGAEQEVLHARVSAVLMAMPAPGVVEGRRYILWANPLKDSGLLHVEPAGWMADVRGFLLLRGDEPERWYAFDGRRYALEATRAFLSSGAVVPLDRVADAETRLRIARDRLRARTFEGYVAGLERLALDAEGEVARGRQASNLPPTVLQQMMGRQPPALLAYQALTMLRDAGTDPTVREDVLRALRAILASSQTGLHLPAAIALAQLGRDEGRPVLRDALKASDGPLSQIGAHSVPGLFPFDESRRAAAAFALGLLGDDGGLASGDTTIQLAAASGLCTHPTARLRKALQQIASGLDRQVERDTAQRRRVRTRGDFTLRVPREWLLARSLLSRLGDDSSLQRLIVAWLDDRRTYPREAAPPFPQMRIATWTPLRAGWPGFTEAIAFSGGDVVTRVRRLAPARWKSSAELAALVRLLEAKVDRPVPQAPSRPPATRAKVQDLLNSKDADRRAEGLAAAGFNGLDDLYPIVLRTAREGKGVERSAAIYGLGWYGRAIGEEDARAILDGSESSQQRLNALELVTRHDAGRFARETLALAEASLRSGDGRQVEHLALILTRMSHGPTLPTALGEALEAADERLQALVVWSLAMGGNPAAVDVLRPLRDRAGPRLRESIDRALVILQP